MADGPSVIACDQSEMDIKTPFPATFEKNLNAELSSSPDPPHAPSTNVNYYPEAPPPPFASFNIPAIPRGRSGIYLPIPIAILLLFIFLLETSVIVFYTSVALYRVLPAAGFSMGVNHCAASSNGAINVAPNIYLPGFVPATSGVQDQVSTISATSTPPVATVTAPAPTVTFFSTIPALPSVTTSTTFSTFEEGRSTVTSIALVTKSAG